MKFDENVNQSKHKVGTAVEDEEVVDQSTFFPQDKTDREWVYNDSYYKGH